MTTLGRTLLCAGLICPVLMNESHAQQVSVSSDGAVGIAVAGPNGLTHVSGNGVALSLDGSGVSGVVAGPGGVRQLKSVTSGPNPFADAGALPSVTMVPGVAGPLNLDLGNMRMSLGNQGSRGISIDLGNGVIQLPQAGGVSLPGIQVGPAGVQVQSGNVSIDTRQGFDVAVGQGSSQIRVSQSAMQALADARQAFLLKDYPLARELCELAARHMAWDPEVQQLRSLTYFAPGDDHMAAAAAYEALSRGDAWDWPMLSRCYADPADYTTQYRALQERSRKSGASAEVHFLMAYHYLMLGHIDSARTELQQMLEVKPGDPLSMELLRRLAPAPSQAPPSVD